MRAHSGPDTCRRLAAILIACLCAAAAAPSLAAAAPIVWVAPDWVRVAPDAPAGTGASLSLFAARGECESFQIIVRGPSTGLTQVAVAAPDLLGPKEQVIPRTDLTLYREHYLHITSPSPDWGGTNRPLGVGWYPDALIPFVNPDTGQDLVGATYDAVPFSVSAGRNQPVWVDVSVPRDAAPGEYQGAFTITSDQGTASATLTLTVWDFELPLRPLLQSCFGNYSADPKGAVRELLRNRLMPRNVSTGDERALIDTQGLNCVNAGFWSGADGDTCTMGSAPSASEFQQEAALHPPDIPLYAYIADEIEHCTSLYNTIKQWARNMHQSRILNLITIAPVPELYSDGSGTGRSAVDIWVVLPKMYDEHKDGVAYVLDKGDQVWSYNCLAQDSYSPKWLVDFAPIDFRIQPGFLNQSLGLNGLLYWRVDYWTSDPWNNVNTYRGGYPGEGVLVYPGAPVGLPNRVVPSMRLKYLRDGVDDYDYIEMLKQRGFGDWALSVAHSLAPDWKFWTRDPAALEAARQQFGPVLQETFRDVPADYWAFTEIMACRKAGLLKGYPDGSYHPLEPVTRAQMAVYISRALAGGDDFVPTGPVTPTFPDVAPDYWAYKYIEYAAAQNVVKGADDGTFNSDLWVDRAQMAAFVARSLCTPTGDAGLASYQPPATPTFKDVDTDYWAYKYIENLAEQGVVLGYPDHSYHPLEAVSRAQMAVYLARAFQVPLASRLLSLAGLPAPPAAPPPKAAAVR